jgi:hypothetical protein
VRLRPRTWQFGTALGAFRSVCRWQCESRGNADVFSAFIGVLARVFGRRGSARKSSVIELEHGQPRLRFDPEAHRKAGFDDAYE